MSSKLQSMQECNKCIIIILKIIGFRRGKSNHHQGCSLVQCGRQKLAESPKFEAADVLFGNVLPYSLVVEKMVKSRHVSCVVWRKIGLSRSECKNVISA